jgi:hypothetical protein
MKELDKPIAQVNMVQRRAMAAEISVIARHLRNPRVSVYDILPLVRSMSAQMESYECRVRTGEVPRVGD